MQIDLFSKASEPTRDNLVDNRKATEELPRIDSNPEIREILLPHCRLSVGEIWTDSVSGHRVGVLDATDSSHIKKLMNGETASLAVCDPPYNVVVGAKVTQALFKTAISEYDQFSERWVDNVIGSLSKNASFYVWMGADYKNGFHPIPEFCQMMREKDGWQARNWITLRNQRGYGTQKNWMWVRQELFYYTKGNPVFNVEAEYTDIPKILRGYYKEVNGKITENMERSRSDTIRAGNVWVDLQQVFYRLEENVPGCYAQKPLKAIERIIRASSKSGDLILDVFSHSGTTLLAGEMLGRKVYTCDLDPIYAELTIRRLEHFQRTKKMGWQWRTPFPEVRA